MTSLVCPSENSVVDHIDLERVLGSLDVPMNNANANARVTTYCADCIERLEIIRRQEFTLAESESPALQVPSRVQTLGLKYEHRWRVGLYTTLEKCVKHFIHTFLPKDTNCEVYGHERNKNKQNNITGTSPSPWKEEARSNKGSSFSKQKLSPNAKRPPECYFPKK